MANLVRGNEVCRISNKDCSVLYGPSLIAAVFKWSVFDAVAFLLAINEGFSATILDMANHIKTEPAPIAIATVRCDTNPSNSTNATRSCSNPRLHLNRDAIIIPGTNQTASQVYTRLDKDCALVSECLIYHS